MSKRKCGCKRFCTDLPESEDSPLAVCKGLPPEPRPPLVEVVLVHRDAEAAR